MGITELLSSRLLCDFWCNVHCLGLGKVALQVEQVGKILPYKLSLYRRAYHFHASWGDKDINAWACCVAWWLGATVYVMPWHVEEAYMRCMFLKACAVML